MLRVGPTYVFAGPLGGARNAVWNGGKFPGGWGVTHINSIDYWELRRRSSQLFTENLYARGLLRRFVTNTINVGLLLEAEPNDELLPNLTNEQAGEWAENVENRFEVYADSPRLCDIEQRRTLPELQAEVKLESMVEGDILVVLHTNVRYAQAEQEK